MKIWFKLFHLIQYGALGMWAPFLPVYLYAQNYSGIQIGLMLGTMPIVTLLFQPVWSYLSDLLRKRKLLLLISCLGMSFALAGLGLAEGFGFAFAWVLLFATFHAPLIPISTAMLLETLEETGEVDKFSLIRLWGSIGYAITSLLVGSLLLGELLRYLVWLAGGLYLILAMLSQLLPEKRTFQAVKHTSSRQIFAGNPRLVLYLLASVFIGATLGVYDNYQTFFLQSLNAQDWLVGLTVSLQAIVEVPMMLMVPYALRRISARWIILAGTLLLPLRWAIYFFVQQAGWVAPSQLIHGVAVVSFYVVGVAFIDQLIHPQWRATGQGLYSAAFNGIGFAMGVYLAGIMFEWYGIRSVWGLNFVLGLIGLGFMLWVFFRPHAGEDYSAVPAHPTGQEQTR